MFNNLFLLRLQEASRKTPEKHQVPSQNFELFSPQISRLIPTNHNQHRLSKSMASSLLNAVKLSLFSPLHLSSSSPSRPSPLSLPRNGSSSFKVAALAQKWESSKVVPQADRVLVRLESLPEKSAGGVLLPKSAVKFERYLMGEVLSVGADVGEVEAGKKVLFSDINAYEVDLGTDAKHCFCRASELLAVVE